MTNYLDKPNDGLILARNRDPLPGALEAFERAQAAYLAEEALVVASWSAGSIRKAGKLEHLETVRNKAAVRVAVLVTERRGK